MSFENSLNYARACDSQDPLRAFRDKFHIPQFNGAPVVYLTGNSLGLQPKSVTAYLLQELHDWASLGVEGHVKAKHPWMPYHEFLTPAMAEIVGAEPSEVVMMNQLTVNLHLLMVSFYRPTGKRKKIICEHKAFPSDQYMFQSQMHWHGLNPETDLISAKPRTGEWHLRTEDIIQLIQMHADELALVCFGGVHYYTGQLMDMPAITRAAHQAGALAGFDLAHAAGNVELKLHDWNIDFAAWCSYKYLNSGPGAVAGIYVHKKHHQRTDLKQFSGWWGHDAASRFKMPETFKPMSTAERWQLSNAPVLSMAACRASLDLFLEAGTSQLFKKSKMLTAYLDFIIRDLNKQYANALEIITPDARGAQVSVVAHGYGKNLFEAMTASGIIADWREPNVIRCAPVPLYNSFEDVFRFGQILSQLQGTL
jgi:kynureninase